MSEIKLTFPEAYELMEAAEKHKRSLGRLYAKASPLVKPILRERYNIMEDTISKLTHITPRKSKEYKL